MNIKIEINDWEKEWWFNDPRWWFRENIVRNTVCKLFGHNNEEVSNDSPYGHVEGTHPVCKRCGWGAVLFA